MIAYNKKHLPIVKLESKVPLTNMALRNATAEFVTRGLNLQNKTILITGITSGIGKETARVLTMRNATVLGTGRTMDAVKQVCSELGEKAVPFVCELRDPKSVRNLVKDVHNTGYRIDAIIANA
jgi:ribitol 2-dehydrogenase